MTRHPSSETAVATRNNTPLAIEARDSDAKLSRFSVAVLLIQLLNSAVKTVIPLGQESWVLVSLLFGFILAVLLSMSIKAMLERVGSSFALATIGVSLLYLLSFSMGYASTSTLLKYASWTLFVALPVAFSAYAVEDKGVLYERLLNASYYAISITLLCVPTLISNSTYSMSLAMMVLPFLLVQMNEAIRTRDPKSAAFSIVGGIFVAVFGNRGAIACILFYIACKFLMSELVRRQRIVVVLISVVVVVIGILSWDAIINIVRWLADVFGFDTYTVRRLANGTWFDSAGREELNATYIQLIAERPLTGYGLCGGWIADGLYPHNGFLTLLLAFGVGLGAIACVAFVATFIKSLTVGSIDDAGMRSLTLIAAACCFTQLISASLAFDSPILYIFIGFTWFGCRTPLESE